MTLGLASLSSWSPIYILLLVLALAFADEQTVLGPIGQPRQSSGFLRRFTWDNEQQRDQILRSAITSNIDIWQLADSHVDIYSPIYGASLPAELTDIPHTLSIVDSHQPQHGLTSSDSWNLESLQKSKYHKTYHPLYEIDLFIQELAVLHPEIIRVHRLGHSAEGREMLGMTLSAPSNNTSLQNPGPGKLGFVITGAQHAREWIATAASTYIAHALVADESEPHSLRSLLDNFDFHIIPVPNPDGYAYTWETDRYWYKNRQVIGPRLKCVGLDMNRHVDRPRAFLCDSHYLLALGILIRNWGYKWKPTVGDVPTMQRSNNTGPVKPVDPCSHWYPGHRPFESPEVNNIANFAATLPNLISFLDLRSYGQMLSAPFSYTCLKWPKDAEDLIEAATGATQALRSIHGTHFETGGLCRLLYPAPGNILDWMYKKVGIKYSYVAHLRDTGTYGFSLPAQLIRPVGEETTKMIEYLSKFIVTRMRRNV